MLWKNDGNAVGRDTYIYAQRMSTDGLDLLSEPVRLFKQDAAWEGERVETPMMWKRDGEFYLFYSANAYFNKSYAVGYATCEEPLGPCRKAPENPVLQTREGAVGPGYVAVIEDGSGKNLGGILRVAAGRGRRGLPGPHPLVRPADVGRRQARHNRPDRSPPTRTGAAVGRVRATHRREEPR